MCNKKQVMTNNLNLKWRPPPSWIYYFCSFWSNVPFPVAALYMAAKFHSSKLIVGRDIAVCAKNLIFVQYFGIPACRTSRVIRVPNFVQICALLNELVVKDKWNSTWRPPPFWIYYFCPFSSNGLFPVVAGYVTAKFHSSTSIGGQDIAVCAKI